MKLPQDNKLEIIRLSQIFNNTVAAYKFHNIVGYDNFYRPEYIDKRFNPDGFNIGINVDEAAGQSIFHVHIHLIPF